MYKLSSKELLECSIIILLILIEIIIPVIMIGFKNKIKIESSQKGEYNTVYRIETSKVVFI